MVCLDNTELKTDNTAAKGLTLVVIDSGITDYTALATAVIPEAVAVVLDGDCDGVVQVTELLQRFPTVTSLHIVAHGAPGYVHLGNSELSLETINRYANQLQSWSVSSLLLYSCNVAAGDAGSEFLAKLHRFTGASIAASSTLVGSAAQGGNWELETRIGEGCDAPAFADHLVQTYTGVFPFSNKTDYSTAGEWAQSIAAGDFNKDGKLDIVVANRKTNTVSVLLGDGQGGFGAATTFATGTEPRSSAIGDFNGDGNLDVITANYATSNVSVLLGDGQGNLAAPITTATDYQNTFNPVSVAVADFNNDGKLDVALGTRTSSNVTILTGNGAGGFTAAKYGTASNVTTALGVGDLNGDGKLDIVNANYFNNSISVLINNGAGGFGAPTTINSIGMVRSIAVGDINGDNAPDVIAFASGQAKVLLNNGSGTLGTPTALTGSYTKGTLADINGDGKLDLIATNEGSDTVSILAGDGIGGFGAPTNLTTGDRPESAVIGDFNKDGKQDIATVNFESSNPVQSTVSVLLNLPDNNAPTSLSLSNSNVDENVAANTTIGTFTTTDPDTGNTFTYSLVAGTGDIDNAAFVIVGNQLQIKSSPDYEAKSSYNIRVRTTDQGGLSFEKQLTIAVTDLPETPQANNLLANPGAETGDMSGWTILQNGGDGWATINDPQAGSKSFITSYNLATRSQLIDLVAKGYTAQQLDQSPTINAEEWFKGFVDANDPNSKDSFSLDKYYLKVELRDANQNVITSWDSGLQTANANWQKLSHTFSNYGAGVRYIYWEDGGDDAEYWAGHYGAQMDNASLTIGLSSNAAPTNLLLGNTAVAENVPADTLIGTFSTTDPDAGNTFTYSLVAGTGDADNAAFTITNNELRIKNSPDFETKNAYNIRVRTTDQGGLSYDREFTIEVSDVNETPGNATPTNLSLSNSSVNENAPADTLVGTLSSTDPDANDTFTYSLVAGTGDADNNAFLVVGDQLKLKSSPNFEAKPSLSIRVRTTDQGGLSFDKVLAVTVNNLNETPTDLSLSSSSVAENVAANTVIGNFATVDPDSGNTFTYSLVSGTGSTDNAAFSIVGNQLRINASPDYETKAAYNIRVRTTDQNGLTFEKPLTITVQDVSESFVQYVASAAADGLQGALNKLQEVFDKQLLQANLPIVGKLSGAIPSFLNTIRDSLVPAIRSASNLTYDSMQTLLNTKLKPLGAQILGNANSNESTFEVKLSQQTAVTKVSSDLGLPGLGLTVNSGNSQGTLKTDLNLVFGSHKDHGFFIETDRTSLNSKLDVGLANFNGQGKMGLYKVKVTDDDKNRSKADATFSTKLKDIDLPGTNDGARLTTPELQRNLTNTGLTTASLNSDPNLGLKISTDMGSAAIPGINTTLKGDIPNLTFSNAQLVGTPTTTFVFNNTELSLGSLANNVVLPTLKAMDKVISPMRPVINLLSYDLKSIGIGYLFPDVDKDGKATLMDMAGLSGGKIATFLSAVKTISDLSQRAASSSNTGLAMGSFRVDNFNPFGSTNSIRSGNVVQTASPLGIDSQLNSAGDSGGLIKDFKRISGVKFNLFDSSSNAVKMLIGQPVNLFTYDMPELSLNFSVQKEKTIEPYPVVVSIGGSVGISADLAFGYDTYGLQQWADANYAANQSSKAFNGFYISDRANPDGTGEDVNEFKLDLGVEIAGGVGITYKPAVSLWGGPYGELKGGPRFDLNDPNKDGKVRGDELFMGSPVNFAGVSVDAGLGAKITGSLGPLEATLAQITFIDTELFKYDARTGSIELLGLPIKDLTNMVRETVDKIYSGIRDLVSRSAQIALEAAKKAAAVVVDTGKKVVNTVTNAVSSTAKKVLGWFGNEPIADGTVFFDANFNGVQDKDEPSAKTFSDGSFGLDLDLTKFDTNQNGVIDASEGQLVGMGGYDTYTGLAHATPFTAPGNAIAINPLTTLVGQMTKDGLSQYEAQVQVANVLGLPPELDFGGFNQVWAIAENDSSGATVEVAYAQINNVLTQTTQLLDGASNLPAQQIREQVIKAIVAQIQPGAKLSFSNAADVQKILQASIANLQAVAANPKLDKLQALIEKVAQVMAGGNQKLDQILAKGNLKNLMEDIGFVRKVTLGKIAEDLEAIGAGKMSIKEFVAENGGKAFDKLVAEAEKSLTRGTDKADFLRGDSKNDRLRGQAGDDQIFGVLGSDRLFGDENNDELFGEDGKDWLEGGVGNDKLNGGLKGDRLVGGVGNDMLAGGDAADVLLGGEGRDRFSLGLGEAGRDRILDFTGKDILEIAGLASLTGTQVGKAISRKNFHLGKQAADGDDYLVYNQKQGILFFDADGNGAIQQTQIAKLTSGLALTPQNVVVA